MNSTSDRPRQNKPNFPKRGTEGVSAVAAVESAHYSNIPSFHHSNAMPTVRNKANLPGYAGRDEARGTGDEGEMRQTNPIPRLRIADFGLRIAY